MKKFFILLGVLFAFCNISYAQEKTPINFVYIHGSDQGTTEEFEIWINRMHPNMKKNLESSEFVQEHLLKSAYIKSDKDMLYWADRTTKDKSIVDVGLKISKMVSSCIAQLTRKTLSHLLHDAIWVQKYSNMQPILCELNKKVIENSQKGEKTVLVGYSAGTFITYQYLIYKTFHFSSIEFFRNNKKSLEISDDTISELEKMNVNDTCIDALTDSKVAILKADGSLIANPDKQLLKEGYKNINSQTELSCSPKNAISGILNFGSPIVIFYSDSIDENSQSAYFMKKLYKQIIEDGIFCLTVNYKTDPLGVPMENITLSQITNEYGIKDIKFNDGFMYDTSVNGGIMFIASHLKYWDQTNHFTKAVAKSYEEGYKKFYGEEQ